MKVGAFFKSGLGCQHFIFTFDHLTKKDTKQGYLSVLMSTSSSHYSFRVEDACGSMTEKKRELYLPRCLPRFPTSLMACRVNFEVLMLVQLTRVINEPV